jgi:LDH2 family malate/lactate/ureidoglycolate dehydrogenase
MPQNKNPSEQSKMAEEQSFQIFRAQYLRDFTTQVFIHFGVPKADAEQAADVLAKSDLRGIDSHGVARLHTYFEMLELGRINPKPKIKIVREKTSVATVDGDNGLGLVVGPKANKIAMDKAEQHGSGWVSVCNTNHFGIAGYYPLKALERDLIGWAMTNTTKLVAPLWGAERMLGTNPIAIAFPGYKEPPIVIDMATSAVAYGKIEIALRKNEPVPKGWIVDKNGGETNNPQDMIDGGAQLPLGSQREMGGHKGYGLASMVDILCCVLSGANWGPFAPPVRAAPGNPGAQRRQRHRPLFRRHADRRLHRQRRVQKTARRLDQSLSQHQTGARNQRPVDSGDPEREAEAIRSKDGIPLIKPVVDDLLDISQKTGIPFEVK